MNQIGRRYGHRTFARRGSARGKGIGFGAAVLAALLFSKPGENTVYETEVLTSALASETPFGVSEIVTTGPRLIALASLQMPKLALQSPPWRRFASVAQIRAGQPAIAIVMDDLGGSLNQVEDVLGLDPALTLSFLPGGADAPRFAAMAHEAGHDVMIHMPMEPNDPGLNPGKGALLTDQDAAMLGRSLNQSLDRFDGYVGINNHMGSRFTRDRRAMTVVLDELKARGLMFLDSKTTLGSQAPDLAKGLRLPLAERDVFIDDDSTPEAIAGQLARLENLARERGVAVAIGHPHATTLGALREWLLIARARGFAIVPISYVAALNCDC